MPIHNSSTSPNSFFSSSRAAATGFDRLQAMLLLQAAVHTCAEECSENRLTRKCNPLNQLQTTVEVMPTEAVPLGRHCSAIAAPSRSGLWLPRSRSKSLEVVRSRSKPLEVTRRRSKSLEAAAFVQEIQNQEVNSKRVLCQRGPSVLCFLSNNLEMFSAITQIQQSF